MNTRPTETIEDPGAVPAPSTDEVTDARPPGRPAAKPATGTPRNDLIPRNILFGNPERANVKISPDGKRLAWIAPVRGVMNLHVAPVGKLDEAKVVTKETTRPIRNYAWAYTNQHLLFEQDVGGDENFHVWKVDLKTNEVVDLTPYPGARGGIADLSHKKPGVVHVTVNNRDPKLMDLHEIDLVTGKSTVVAQNTEGFSSYVTDEALELRFATKSEPDGSVTVHQRTKDGWAAYDRVPFEDSETAVLGVVGGTAYLRDTRNRDTAALVALDIKTKKTKVLAEDVRADAGAVMFQPKKLVPQAVAFNYLRVDWKVLDGSIKGDLAALGKLGGDPRVTSRTLDDSQWIVGLNSDQKPGRIYLWNRKTKKATFLFSAQPALDSQPLVAMKPVEIAARDGLKLVSYLSLPAGSDPDADGTPDQPKPMVLLVHGGPWGRDAWGYHPYHQWLANRGYAVLSVNFRASTGFGKKFLNAGNLQWGKTMHDDLLDAVSWAVHSKITPKDKVCIMGGSYGGYATLAGVAMSPDVFACGVDIVGPSNLITLLGSIPPYWAPIVAMFHKRMGDPSTPEGKAMLVEASPLTHAKNIRRPLLIAQGANDPRVKQAESEQIVAAMKKLGLPVTYALFPDEGHGFARPENSIAFVAITEAFLSAHIGGVYQPISKDELSGSSLQIKEGREGIPGM